MDLSVLREWLIPVSTAVGIVSAVVGAFLTLRDFKIKLNAEARLAEASKVEADVKLLRLFIDLMDVAHARGQSVLMPEKLFEVVWPEMRKTGHVDPVRAAIVTLPVGAAAQDAAIVAIATLGKKHSVLRPVAEQALVSLCTFKESVARPLLQQLRDMR